MIGAFALFPVRQNEENDEGREGKQFTHFDDEDGVRPTAERDLPLVALLSAVLDCRVAEVENEEDVQDDPEGQEKNSENYLEDELQRAFSVNTA